MKIVTIQDAQANLLTLVEDAAKGHPFMIEVAGKVLVKILPADDRVPIIPLRLGFMTGSFPVPDDFDTLKNDDIESMFEGKK